MRLLIRSNRTSLLALLVVIALVLLAIVVTALTPSPRPVLIGKSVTIYHAPKTGGGISVPGYFVRARQHHPWCQRPVTVAKRGIHGVFRQRFQHCAMAIGPVAVTRLGAPTPRVTAAGIARPATPAPPPLQVSTATTQPISTNSPAPHTASCQQGNSTDCALMLVDLINVERVQHGVPPLSYSTLLTNGTDSCVGAIGHAAHMANDLHTIAHDQFPGDVCAGTAMGENVGVSAYGSLYADAMQIHTGMMTGPSEVYTPGCSNNHHCDWMDPNHTHVGLAFVAGTFQGLPAHYESEEYSNAG